MTQIDTTNRDNLHAVKLSNGIDRYFNVLS